MSENPSLSPAVPASKAAPSLFRTPDGKNYLVPFLLIASLFLLWGFCHGLMDVLDKHFQDSLHIVKAKSAMVQFSGYIGYFFMAMPAGWIARRFGYKGGVLTGLAIICAGALWFIPATKLAAFVGTDAYTALSQAWYIPSGQNAAFAMFLTGLFIIFGGLTCLETVANPYTTVLGPEQTSAARINFAQSLNSVGWIFGPLIGSQFLFSSSAQAAGQDQLWIPYAGVAVIVAILFVVFWNVKLPEIKAVDHYQDEANPDASPTRALGSHKHFLGAVGAQFCYVAAQTGIFSFFINYMSQDTPPLGPGAVAFLARFPADWTHVVHGATHIADAGSAHFLSLGGFTLFFLGRFIGGVLLRRVHAHKLLGVYAVTCALLMGGIVLNRGWFSPVCLLLTFFFMSIMFPTVFALGLHGLGAQTKRASSFIVMAIVGGAVMPMAMGRVADIYGSMVPGFVVPMICFALIAIYGLLWSKLSGSEGITGISAAGH
jgi:FHS family L-fucose permease-like MFS transporter